MATIIHDASLAINPDRSQVTDLGSGSKPAANPTLKNGLEWGYSDYQAPLFGGSQRVQPSDVVQAGSSVNDCYMLTDLQALAGLNSDFIKNHVKEIDNPDDPSHPNYQVTLYLDGKPTDVVVDGKQMLATEGKSDAGAGAGLPDATQGPSTSLWPTVYEKAYAVATGRSISQLDFNYADVAWKVLTGADGKMEDEMPKEGAKFASDVAQKKQEGGGTVIGSIKDLMGFPDFDLMKMTASFDNGRYTVSQNLKTSLMTVTDTQSPTGESWSIPANHAMNVKSVTSFDSSNPDPTKVTDNSKLSVNIENPYGPSVTNSGNLQSMPYEVVRAMSSAYFTLDPPFASKG